MSSSLRDVKFARLNRFKVRGRYLRHALPAESASQRSSDVNVRGNCCTPRRVIKAVEARISVSIDVGIILMSAS